MTSIELTVSAVLRRINHRIRIAPSELFRSVDCLWLILFDDSLFCPENGRRYCLEAAEVDLDDDRQLERLAEGARQLCSGIDRPIGLALPLSQFLYSHYSIQLGNEYLADRDMVHSAIALQRDILLPAFEQDFALSAAIGGAKGAAFWLPESVLGRLQSDFAGAGLELVAVLPRPLAAAPADGSTRDYAVADSDASTCSVVWTEEGVLTRVLSAFRQEFDNADIRSAWDEQTSPLLAGSTISLSSADDWLALGKMTQVPADYLLFTREFLHSVNVRNRHRRLWAGGALAAAAALFLSLPFVYQWTDAIRLERSRDAFRELARVAESYENEILDMEYEWGIVYEYPEPDVSAILTALNSVIDNSLTSFSLTDSTIEIQGFTEDPERLTRLLLEQPVFESIEQSRSISESNAGRGDRFGLRLTLSGHNYAGYSRKYDFR